MKKLKLSTEFFSGRLYLLAMTVLLLVGYIARIEAYTAALNMLIVALALVYSGSVRPLIFFVLTFFYQITVANSPTLPNPSDNYFTGIRPYLLVSGAVILIGAVFVYIFKYGLLTKKNFLKIPLFVPTMVLTLGLLANGLFSENYTVSSLLWGMALVVTYTVLFLLFYLGLSGEDMSDTVDWFTDVTLLLSLIMLVQFAGILLSGDYINDSGVVNRGAMALGIGGPNEIGFHLSMLIPMNFYGFMKGKRPYLSLTAAILVYGATLMSTSRNSALVGSAYFVLCVVLSMIFGDRKRIARRIIPACAAVCVVLLAILHEPVMKIIEHYLERGMGDSGRFGIWERCFEIFKENPVFGVGFFGLEVGLGGGLITSIVPEFAHNTVFELLAVTGLFGTACYAFYRFCTVKYLLYKPTLDRMMLLLGASMLLSESMLDNYVFHIFSGFYYTAAITIATLLCEKRRQSDELILK